MANNKQHDRDNGRWLFMREFLRHPLQIGSIIPSSRFLERRVVEAAGGESADVIVELGPGTGGLTRAVLNVMAPQARLVSIELNPRFHGLLQQIDDDRLVPHLGSAGDLEEILDEYRLDTPNAVISGIPFSTMSRNDGARVLDVVSSLLAPGGCFVAYQVRSRVADLCQPFLGPGEATTEILNIPPMRIYRWVKPADAGLDDQRAAASLGTPG